MNQTRKGMSVILVVSILLSMFAIVGSTMVFAEETEGTVALYLKNNAQWDSVVALTGSGTVEAQAVAGSADTYKVMLADTVDSVKFANSGQTETTKEITGFTSGQIYLLDTNQKQAGNPVVYGGKLDQYQVNNVILMIGDGMGAEHIKAGGIYIGDKMEMTKMPYSTMVNTYSLGSGYTDSAAAATAMATGYKTADGKIGMLANDTKVETLCEFAQQRGMKSGVIATQVLPHATPASFTAHVPGRYSYGSIASQQLKSEVDILLGGGGAYFENREEALKKYNYTKITDVNEINSVAADKNVLGVFHDSYITADDGVKLSQMSKEGLKRLDNDNGFFVMIEGSDIDSRAHNNEMSLMLKELEVFNDAIKVAWDYVKENPDTLLVVTADHETGNLTIPANAKKEDLTDGLFKSTAHTGVDVPLYAVGARAWDLCDKDIIDNTEIYKFIADSLNDTYGTAPTKTFEDLDKKRIFFELPDTWENPHVFVEGDINSDSEKGALMSHVADNVYQLNLHYYRQEMAGGKGLVQSGASASAVGTSEGIYLLGDVDVSGDINIKDATYLQKVLVELETADEIQDILSDVNKDNAINIKDVTEIQKYLADYDNIYGIGQPVEINPTDITEPTGSTEPSGSSEPTASTEPSGSTVPIDSTEPSSSTVPTDSTEPSSSTEPTVSTEPSDSSEPTVPTEPTDPSDTVTVYFRDDLNWGKAYAYNYFEDGTEGLGEYPGTAMTFVEKDSTGKSIYKITIAKNTKGVVFSNGATAQTVDVITNLVDGAGYYCPGSKVGVNYKVGAYQVEAPVETDPLDGLTLKFVFNDGKDYKTVKVDFEGYNKIFKILENHETGEATGTWEDYTPSRGYIYFEKPAAWKDAYMYSWGGAYFGEWPGRQMEKVPGEENLYRMLLSDDELDEVGSMLEFDLVFNQGDNVKQTVDLEFAGLNKVYKILTGEDSNKAAGVWYDYGSGPVGPGDPMTIYMKDQITNWDITDHGALFYALCDNGDKVPMTKLEDARIWSATVPDNFVSIAFLRVNPENGEIWNVFSPTTAREENNMYVLTATTSGKWAVYDPDEKPEPEPEPNPEDVTIYYTIPQEWLDNGYYLRVNCQEDNLHATAKWVLPYPEVEATSLEVDGNPVYMSKFKVNYGGAYKLQIQAYSDAAFTTWKAQINAINAKWTELSVFNNKYYNGSKWVNLDGSDPGDPDPDLTSVTVYYIPSDTWISSGYTYAVNYKQDDGTGTGDWLPSPLPVMEKTNKTIGGKAVYSATFDVNADYCYAMQFQALLDGTFKAQTRAVYNVSTPVETVNGKLYTNGTGKDGSGGTWNTPAFD